MVDPTIIVAGIMGASAVLVAVVTHGIKRATGKADAQVAQQVQQAGVAATAQADESAKQLGVDVGGVVSAAITAAVQPVSTRLAIVEGEVRVLRGDLVPVAVADRDIVLAAVADGLVHRDKVLLIPESVATLYPHHLRHIPHPTLTSPEESTP